MVLVWQDPAVIYVGILGPLAWKIGKQSAWLDRCKETRLVGTSAIFKVVNATLYLPATLVLANVMFAHVQLAEALQVIATRKARYRQTKSSTVSIPVAILTRLFPASLAEISPVFHTDHSIPVLSATFRRPLVPQQYLLLQLWFSRSRDKRTELEGCRPGDDGQDVALGNLAGALYDRFQAEGNVDDVDEAITLHRAALELRPPGHPERSLSLYGLSLCFLSRYDSRGVVMDLEEAVTFGRAGLELCPPDHRDRGLFLNNVAFGLCKRFTEQTTMCDLDEAFDLHRAALELHPSGHPDQSSSLHGLALCFSSRYDNQGVVADLEEAITLGRAALDLRPPGHPSRGVSLSNIALYLGKRFGEQAAMCDLNKAFELQRAALELHPSGHPQRYENRGVVADLEEAITLGRAALDLRPPGHPSRGVSLSNLALYLWERFREQAAMCDLNEAFELQRAALELHPSGHPQRSFSLHGLALCFSSGYDNQGVVADLEEAVTRGRAALELRPPGHPDRGVSLNNLAVDLGKRFQEQAVMSDLDEAIELHRAALELRPSGHPQRSSSLHGLASCFSSRYDNQGVVADLEEAVTLGRAALELCPPGRPERGASLNNLAVDLMKRFRKQAAMCDLDEAFELHRAGLELYPSGHPWRFWSLLGLSICYLSRYDSQGVVADLEEAVMLGHAAVELCPPRHSRRARCLYHLSCAVWTTFQRQALMPRSGGARFVRRVTLALRPINNVHAAFSFHALSLHLWDKFRKQSAIAYLDDAICLATYALGLRLSKRHSASASVEKLALFISERAQRVVPEASPNDSVMLGRAVDSLCALGHYLKDRFRNHHAIVDLNKAISLHRYVLQLCPAGHASHPSNLHYLALCLIERFHDTAAVSDLDEAISLEQTALELSTPGDPSYDVSKDCLATCFQMKISPQVSRVSSIRSVATEYEVSQVIQRVIFETLETMPVRLLHTQTGTLCDRDAQISHFVNGPQYKQLLSSALSYDPVERVCRIYTVVSTCFRFVMFSHRWGEGEPSLRDIQGRAIYDMPPNGGVKKLQKFCLTTFKRGYLSAWSDTCCIDKTSSAELQEAVGSMFGWYRRSHLTIVYLADVPESGSFDSSQWFERGWTLQELLAPANGAVLDALARATGIASRFLTDFTPGMDDARSRLQWASSPRTTRPEDIAYSLFGIFNLHLPVLYGESAEFALGPLLAEVVSQSGDTSILDWVGEASTFHSCFPARITSYRTLPLPVPPPDAAEQSSIASQQSASSNAVRKLCRSLNKLPLPRFVNRRLTLPCFSHRVRTVRQKSADPLSPTYTYEIQASGLRPLEITLPEQLEHAASLPCGLENVAGALQLVRPWHSKSLSGTAKLDAAATEQLLVTLRRPFSALLLAELPHNEYKRIASSTLIAAEPVDLASFLQCKVRMFNIV
ncbi:hypothetical protein EDC04DRAFT_2609837 [Pisolithus marmoratus]|nr:hypothetical protein EDC04DRAFT_2609837 [Pisolithus marmoratus]